MEFLDENKLNSKIADILADATENVYIITPYIRLHSRIHDTLIEFRDQYNIRLHIVYRSNPKGKKQNLTREDFEFLKSFNNIVIYSNDRLHAKIYANDSEVLVTSMNLYKYSHDNNIEVGMVMSKNANDEERRNYDQAIHLIQRIQNTSVKEYEQFPEITKVPKKGLLKYLTKSDIQINYKVTDHLTSKYSIPATGNQIYTRPDLPNRSNISKSGYCIRTGKRIQLNHKRPFDFGAFAEWKKEGMKEEAPEKFCHFSGNLSQGKTSKKQPILRNYWNEYRKVTENLSIKG